MKNSFPTESTIRQYLLGRLDDQEDLERSLSEQMFYDDELSEMVDAIEDEIIEDYLDGTMNAADKKAVEEYFLRPPEHREKVRFARRLRHRLTPKPASDPKPFWRVLHQHAHFRTYCELAALLLLAIPSLYLIKVRHDLQSQIEATRTVQRERENELAQERERSTSLAKQVDGLQPSVDFSWSKPIYRAKESALQVQVSPFAQRIRVTIDNVLAATYDVRLSDGVVQIWEQKDLTPSSGKLRFDIPAKGIKTGHYRLMVSSQPAHAPKEYFCYVRIAQ